MVFVLEKSRQFWANIFGNTMCRSFLKRTSASCFFSVIIPPEDAVISVANHEKAEQSVGDMDVKDKVQWIFLPHNQYIDTCVFWLYKGIVFQQRYRLWKLVNDIPDRVNRRMSVRRRGVPGPVQIRSFGSRLF